MTSATTAIAMEFCEGRSLEAVYKMVQRRGGRTHENVVGKIACGVLGGLTYLHEKRIIHRGMYLSVGVDCRRKAWEYSNDKKGGGQVM
jgi:mitogen-activated protein kinase kinase